MHDTHRLHPAPAQMKEGTVVVARGQGIVHFLQPRSRLVGGCGALRYHCEQQADHCAGGEPRRPDWQPTPHGATRASGGRFPGGRSLTARPVAAAPAAPVSSASAPESRSFRTSFCPKTEEYLLWANT